MINKCDLTQGTNNGEENLFVMTEKRVIFFKFCLLPGGIEQPNAQMW